MYTDKEQLLSYFRNMSSVELVNIQRSTIDYKKMASIINTVIRNIKEQVISDMLHAAKINQWKNKNILDAVLMITYAAYIVMLESRNSVWPYEYMAFARRIGELWEPFCKEVFNYSIRPIELIDPPVFAAVKDNIIKYVDEYISNIDVDNATKRQLSYYYRIPW